MECSICPVGKSQKNEHEKICIDCPIGKYQNKIQSPVCISCIPGRYTDQKQQVGCKLCQAGQFNEVVKSTTCKVCPDGWSNGDLGQSACGRLICFSPFLSSPSLLLTYVLTFHSFISFLLLKRIIDRNHLLYCHFFCSPPSLLLKSTRPSLDLRSPLAVTCIPGMYQNEKSQVKCKLCALDHYSEVSKAIECKSCPLGWSSKEGKFFCVACSAGKKVSDNIYRGKTFSRLFLFTNIFASFFFLHFFFFFSLLAFAYYQVV